MFDFNIPLIPFDPNPSTRVRTSIRISNTSIACSFQIQSSAFLAKASKALATWQENLWSSTCFELFVAHPNHSDYLEWNLSSEGHYSVYGFSDIRKQRILTEQEKHQLTPKEFCSIIGNSSFQLQFTLNKKCLSQYFESSRWKIKPTCILRIGENLTYWAPNHSDKRPNFHTFDKTPIFL
ncbi:MAG: hypothetical protein KDD61_13810 [Bdellovibrionales bacterium]|nr:hypothetical protein [Bdellovibrionales bacterium]